LEWGKTGQQRIGDRDGAELLPDEPENPARQASARAALKEG